MTAPTPPPSDRDRLGQPDDGFDARLELVHASVDGELTEAESSAVKPDEAWRVQVEEARLVRDSIKSALILPDVAGSQRESHIAAALAEFDSLPLGDEGASDLPPPSGLPHAAPPPPPGAGPGDELAHRRNARAWVSKLPIGIAAAVLAAVVVIGAAQMNDDSDTTLADGDQTADEDREFSSSEDAAESQADGAPAPADAEPDGMAVYTWNAKPDSLDDFSASVEATGRGGSEMPSPALPTDAFDFDSDCSKADVMDLLGPNLDAENLTLVEGVVEGRDVVGVVDRTNPSRVIVIDLESCEVVSER